MYRRLVSSPVFGEGGPVCDRHRLVVYLTMTSRYARSTTGNQTATVGKHGFVNPFLRLHLLLRHVPLSIFCCQQCMCICVGERGMNEKVTG